LSLTALNAFLRKTLKKASAALPLEEIGSQIIRLNEVYEQVYYIMSKSIKP